MTTLGAAVRVTRPKQWVKNLLVLAAPLAAGAIGEPDVLGATLAALVAFVLMSSAVYAVNDCVDVEADRRHPQKCRRPLASGEIGRASVVALAVVLAALGLLLAWWVDGALLVLLLSYLVLQLAYALWLKHEPVVDLVVVSAGFLMRAVAGGVAADLPISQWFLLVAGFGSLFIVSGKRYSELHTLGQEAGTRRSLTRYTVPYLRFVWGVAAGATMLTYCLWAFEMAETEGVPWHTLSIAPFVVGVLRYAVHIDVGTAAEPEDMLWHDTFLQATGGLWFTVLMIGVWS